MSEHETRLLPMPMYAEGKSNNENPNGQSGIDGFCVVSRDLSPLQYLKWLYEAKDNMIFEHERQLLNDVKRLKKHKGAPRKIYPLKVDTKLWMEKADREIVRLTKELIA